MPSINAVTSTVNGSEIYTYPTSVLTQGGQDYAQHTTQKPMTVIYTMHNTRIPTLRVSVTHVLCYV